MWFLPHLSYEHVILPRGKKNFFLCKIMARTQAQVPGWAVYYRLCLLLALFFASGESGARARGHCFLVCSMQMLQQIIEI